MFSTGRTFELHFTVECVAGMKGGSSGHLQGGSSTIWCNTILPASPTTGRPARRYSGSHTADFAVATQLGQVALVLRSPCRPSYPTCLVTDLGSNPDPLGPTSVTEVVSHRDVTESKSSQARLCYPNFIFFIQKYKERTTH